MSIDCPDVAAAWETTLAARERLIAAVTDSIADDRGMSARERRRWLRWATLATADVADMRVNSPFPGEGSP